MKHTRMIVFCTLRFEALHSCPSQVCPEKAYYLTYVHRHEFHVRCEAPVHGRNREIEFITMKQEINEYIQQNWHGKDLGNMSCEQMADALITVFPYLDLVEVSEDGENGAVAIVEDGDEVQP